jgi:hypothetical protein
VSIGNYRFHSARDPFESRCILFVRGFHRRYLGFVGIDRRLEHKPRLVGTHNHKRRNVWDLFEGRGRCSLRRRWGKEKSRRGNGIVHQCSFVLGSRGGYKPHSEVDRLRDGRSSLRLFGPLHKWLRLKHKCKGNLHTDSFHRCKGFLRGNADCKHRSVGGRWQVSRRR